MIVPMNNELCKQSRHVGLIKLLHLSGQFHFDNTESMQLNFQNCEDSLKSIVSAVSYDGDNAMCLKRPLTHGRRTRRACAEAFTRGKVRVYGSMMLSFGKVV